MGKLFGIRHSNRKNTQFWTKNRFNSSFPAALANYMFAHDIPVNYIVLGQDLRTHIVPLPVRELYNMGTRSLDELYFAFESRYAPYAAYARERIDGIDLVIQAADTKEYLRPLEVKLTVIPDKYTSKNRDQSLWGSELVFRSATTQYCALGMTHSLRDRLGEIRALFEAPCDGIQDWNNRREVWTSFPELLALANDFECRYYGSQQPLVMQPVWKTCGQDPLLVEEGTFDIFVWSDFAFSRLFLDMPREEYNAEKPLSRQNRAAVRFVRYWYEVSRSGRVDMKNIYSQMTYGLQTDKEFSANGSITNPYMKCDRLAHPAIDREKLYEIVLDGGEELLMPERRLDQSVLYYTMKNPRTRP